MYSVLNVGSCDKGITLPSIYADWEVTSLDVNVDAQPDLLMDVRHLASTPKQQAKYHSVYLSHILEHFTPDQTKSVLDACKFVLVPGGFIFLRVPSLELMLQSLNKFDLGLQDELSKVSAIPAGITGHMMIFGKDEPWMHHYRHFTGNEMVSVLEQSEFSACKASYWPYGLEIWALGTNGPIDPLLECAIKEKLF